MASEKKFGWPSILIAGAVIAIGVWFLARHDWSSKEKGKVLESASQSQSQQASAPVAPEVKAPEVPYVNGSVGKPLDTNPNTTEKLVVFLNKPGTSVLVEEVTAVDKYMNPTGWAPLVTLTSSVPVLSPAGGNGGTWYKINGCITHVIYTIGTREVFQLTYDGTKITQERRLRT